MRRGRARGQPAPPGKSRGGAGAGRRGGHRAGLVSHGPRLNPQVTGTRERAHCGHWPLPGGRIGLSRRARAS
jgi:hypothetical protein